MAATKEELQAAAKTIGFTIPPDHEEDYLKLLGKTDAAIEAVLSQPDYKPVPDFARFPRQNVHLPQKSDNPTGGWSWRAEVGGSFEVGPERDTKRLLSGKTVVYKDTVCIAEVPLVLGTNAFEGYVPDVDATVVTRTLEHGGHILGKAACENFSHGATSFSSPYGPVENPYARGFSTGGSSSGCGALVGSGAADMAIGGDQGGSIRIPASLCGIVGLKPTFGLVPYTGVEVSSDSGVDHVGPMARTVLDTAALLQATAGYDGYDDRQLGAPLPGDLPKYTELVLASRGKSLEGVKLGVLREGFTGMRPDLDELVAGAISKYASLGAEIIDVSAPLHKLSGSMSHIINKFASSGSRQGRQVGRRGVYLNDFYDQLLPWTQDKYEKAKYYVTGTALSAEYGWNKHPTAYGRAMNLSRKLSDEFDAILRTCDAIVMPTVSRPAGRHAAKDAGPLTWNEASALTANTAANNLTGHPSLSIPVGFVPPMPVDIREKGDENIKLPVGMMIMGKRFDEATVFCLGDAWEQAFDWKV